MASELCRTLVIGSLKPSALATLNPQSLRRHPAPLHPQRLHPKALKEANEQNTAGHLREVLKPKA